MKVRIINGTYGLSVGQGVVKPVTFRDGAIEVPETEAQWLISQGIAQAIKEKSEVKSEEVPEKVENTEKKSEKPIATKNKKPTKKRDEPFLDGSDIVNG